MGKDFCDSGMTWRGNPCIIATRMNDSDGNEVEMRRQNHILRPCMGKWVSTVLTALLIIGSLQIVPDAPARDAMGADTVTHYIECPSWLPKWMCL